MRDQLSTLGLQVQEDALPRLLWLLEELLRWNRRINLTAVVDFREGVEKHLVDSLTPLPFLRGTERFLDIGSGGGFPGLPLKLARPLLKVCSVEAVGKKAAFQKHAVRQLRIQGFEVLTARAETLGRDPELAGGFDLVTARALASLPEFASLALPFLAPGGAILAMKGAEGESELAEAGDRLRNLGLVPETVHRLRLPVSGAERTLILLRDAGVR